MNQITPLTKEKILSLIFEQVSELELNEMPRRALGVEHPLWTDAENIPEPKTFRESDFYSQDELNQWIINFTTQRGKNPSKYRLNTLINTEKGKLFSFNPEMKKTTGRVQDPKFRTATEDELIENVAIVDRVRQSKMIPEIKIYLYDSYGYLPPTTDVYQNAIHHKKDMFILVWDGDPNRPLALLGDLRRNALLETKWEMPNEPQYTSDTYTKKYIHYTKINDLFERDDIKIHLYRCGLPPIMAKKEFDQPITHKKNEQKYTAPNYNFLLSGIWPATDVQSALDLIIQYREAIALGENPPEIPPPTHMPRNPRYDYVYGGGAWKFAQKIADKKPSERTKKLRLWMKAIAGGQLSFYIGTDLQIIGSAENGTMIMTATFSSVSEIRSAGEEWAKYKIEPIRPISVHVRSLIPPNVNMTALEDGDFEIELLRNAKRTVEFEFLSGIYDTLMAQLGDEILKIDPDNSIDNYLKFEPDDIEMEIDEETMINESKKPKIKITESQLEMLMKNKKPKIKITESQLERLMGTKTK